MRAKCPHFVIITPVFNNNCYVTAASAQRDAANIPLYHSFEVFASDFYKKNAQKMIPKLV